MALNIFILSKYIQMYQILMKEGVIMNKNVIYVDFIFTHKKINYLTFHIIYPLSFLKKAVYFISSLYNNLDIEKPKIKNVQ